MPKQKTDDLIQLIKSMTRAEKRHFRLFVKRNQSSEDILFLKLFDFLDKKQAYNEPLILKKLVGIKKRQLSNLKAHLYKQLLMSLRLLSRNYDIDIQIREQIDYARVLYNKGLYSQSQDVLDKAKIKALKVKKYDLALEIVEFEKLIEGQYVTQSIQNRADELAKMSIKLRKIIDRIQELSNLSLQLYGQYLKMGYVRNRKDYFYVKEFFQSRLPQYAIEDLGFYEKLHFYQAHFWFHYTTHEFVYCYKYAQKWVDLFQDEPEMIELEKPLYLKALHLLLNTLFNVWQYDKFIAVLKELKGFPKKYDIKHNKNVENLYFLYLYNHIIKKHFMEGTASKGLKIVPEIMERIESEDCNWDDHRIMLFYYRIACLFFTSGNNSVAIDYLNKIVNAKNPDYREDIQSFARILLLIAHFELGNVRLIEYQVKSVYRFLGKKEDLHSVQKEIFRFLRKLPKIREKELKGEFIKLKEKLEKVRTDPYERRPFLYLDIISWLESKIEDKGVQEIIREKFLKGESPVG